MENKWDDCETPWIDELHSEKNVLEQQLDIALSAFDHITGPSISSSTPKEILTIYNIIWEAQEKIKEIGKN